MSEAERRFEGRLSAFSLRTAGSNFSAHVGRSYSLSNSASRTGLAVTKVTEAGDGFLEGGHHARNRVVEGRFSVEVRLPKPL